MGANNNRKPWSTKKKAITMPEEYADWTLEELEAEATPKHLSFREQYIKHKGNLTKAYRDSIFIVEPKNKQWLKGKTDTQISDRINGAPQQLVSRNMLVRALIVKTQEEIAQKSRYEAQMSYDGWAKRLISLRDKAAQAEQYSPAIRGHELLGKAAGHIDSNRQDQASRVDDRLLTSKLADILGTTADTLNSALAGSQDVSRTIEAEDAEVIGPEALPPA